MRIAISVDMEGISGTVSFKQITENTPEFARAQRLATADVNAAIAGARQAGAARFFIHDTHSLNQINLLIDQLDDTAEYVGGQPLLLWQDLTADYDAVFLIGYHGRAGQPGIMSHLYSDLLRDVRLNGTPVGEGIFTAGMAGYYNLPAILVTGDDYACADLRRWCPTIETAQTKTSLTRYAVRCLPVKEAQSNIKEAAQRAVAGLANHQPLKIETPTTLEVRWNNNQTARSVALMPSVELDGLDVTRFTHADFAEVDRCLKAMLHIAVSPINGGRNLEP